MKKIITSILTVLSIFSLSAMPAFAISASKANGDVRYTAYGVERFATFNVKETGLACGTKWDVTGNYTVGFELDGNPPAYVHDMSLTQSGSDVSGNGGYPAGGPYAYEWNVTTGSVSASTINLTVDYTVGAPGTTMHMTGAIAPDGTMSGTWDDNFGGTRSGTWSTASGAATPSTVDCAGKGSFSYIDVNGSYYVVKVKNVNVSGNSAWFAGPVVYGNVGTGQWLFAKVVDNGEPGKNHDEVWGSFMTQSAAVLGVAQMSNPSAGPFVIWSGNIQVH